MLVADGATQFLTISEGSEQLYRSKFWNMVKCPTTIPIVEIYSNCGAEIRFDRKEN